MCAAHWRTPTSIVPKGRLIEGPQALTITANDQIFKADEYKPLIIRYQNGAPVRVGDVAQVRDSVENIRNAGLMDAKPAVILVVFKQPGANVISTVDLLRKLMPNFACRNSSRHGFDRGHGSHADYSCLVTRCGINLDGLQLFW